MHKWTVVLACLAAFVCAGAHAQVSVSKISVNNMTVYKTSRQAEAVAVLALPKRIKTPTGTGFQEAYTVIFSIPVAGLAERDVLQVSAEMEATNDCSYDVGFGTWLVIGTDASSTVPNAARGESYMSYPSGYNITNGNYQIPGAADRSFGHHGSVTRSTVFVVPRGMSGTRYVNFVAYAQTDKLDCRKGNGLTVEKGAGHLSVIHYSVQ